MKKALMTASVASMIEFFNMNNIQLLQSMGYEVHVACNFEKGNVSEQSRVKEFQRQLVSNGIKSYNIPIPRKITSIKELLYSYKAMIHIMKKNKYELVHCHTPIGGVITRLACKSLKDTETKVIYTAHGFHFYKGAPWINWLLYYPVERYCSRYTDYLITINKEDYIRSKTLKAKKNCYVPGVGIACVEYMEQNIDHKSKRMELGILDNSIVLLSVGELNKNKNHEVIIKALAELENKNFYYIICGQGKLKEKLQSIINENGLAENVKLFGFRSDISEIYKVSDVFIFPSFREGLSVSLMEAMASGLPCIVSDIRGNHDLITDSNCLCNPKEHISFIEPIESMVNNKSLRIEQGRINAQRIQEFDIAIIEKCMQKIYKSCNDK
jgi:Glycosyltransferase